MRAVRPTSHQVPQPMATASRTNRLWLAIGPQLDAVSVQCSMTPERNQVLQGLPRGRYWSTGVIVQEDMTSYLHARRIPRSVRTTGETLSRTRQSSRYLSEIQMDRSGRRLCGDGGTMPPDLRVRQSEEVGVVNVLKQGRRA